MRNALFILLVLFSLSTVHAREYGNYDPKRMLTSSETPQGKRFSIDVTYIDQMLRDLSLHAGNYPPQFDTPQDKERAVKDAKLLSGVFDVLTNVQKPDSELLTRAGLLNGIGHNLGIAGSAGKANAIFRKLLTISPSDPRGNFAYGVFLSGVGKFREALPFLEKALANGVNDATHTIGLVYLALGDKAKALENLETYKQHKPDDKNVDSVIEAIRNGKVEIRKTEEPAANTP